MRERTPSQGPSGGGHGCPSDGPRTDRAASRGLPSSWWRHGQDRRLALIAAHAHLEGRVALDLGCGNGAYTHRLAELGASAIGLEIERDRAAAAHAGGLMVALGVGEHLPLGSGSVDVILLHEVLEHVADDLLTLRECAFVLRPGGRVLVFVPNRLWPFETHGVYWRGTYRFGNVPFVNYLPDALRHRFAPHVRVYTRGRLRRLAAAAGLEVVHVDGVFPGYDKLIAGRPSVGRWARAISRALERTPLRRMGLSHFVVMAKPG
jgi:SAM-dependent methyltransferase